VVVRISFAAAAVAQAALPSFSSLHQLRESRALLIQYRKLQDLICYGMVPLFTAAVFGAIPIYSYLFNRQVAEALLLPTALLCVGYFMSATVLIPYTFSVASGRPDIASRSNLIALFAVIPVTTTAIYFFGLTGAATSWVVYHLFLYGYMIPRICRECLLISTRSWYAHVVRVFGVSALTYGAVWILVVIPNSYSLTALIVAYVAASLVFLGVAFLMIGSDLRETIRRLRPRIGSQRSSSVS